jgi:hypothetical protein
MREVPKPFFRDIIITNLLSVGPQDINEHNNFFLYKVLSEFNIAIQEENVPVIINLKTRITDQLCNIASVHDEKEKGGLYKLPNTITIRMSAFIDQKSNTMVYDVILIASQDP